MMLTCCTPWCQNKGLPLSDADVFLCGACTLMLEEVLRRAEQNHPERGPIQ